jgi:nucleotidyltransferase/DNA polymerase involved in DNA repair
MPQLRIRFERGAAFLIRKEGRKIFLDFRFLFAILPNGRGNGKQVAPAPFPYRLSRAGGRLLDLLAAGGAMTATLQSTAHPHIVHVRSHGFFAAVEQSLRPRLRGKPVVVGGNTVISASSEAAAFGITAGMAVERVLTLCPAANVVPACHERYAEFSERLRAILKSFTPAVDPDSGYGFYLNFFGSAHLQGDFAGVLLRLQLEILKLTGLSVSIGAAKSKIAAAVASRLQSPGSIRAVVPGTEAAYLAPLPVEALDGLHSIDGRSLRIRGIQTIGELRRVPLAALEFAFGEPLARQIWRNARGLDARPKTKPLASFPRSALPTLSALPSLFREFATAFLSI